MNVALIDVDGHNGFPNLALMKLSAYHKHKGDHVEWYSPWSGQYDKAYMSKVFTFSKDEDRYINADVIEKGGTGYKEYEKKLPDEIEHTFPDYTIYPSCDYAIGFLTRGCIRCCPWCVVPKKEGKIHAAATWQEVVRADSKKVRFLDNNVLASEHGIRQIEELSNIYIYIDFNQGLDARLIDDSVAKLLAKCRWETFLRISCDTSAMIPVVKETVERLTKNGMRAQKIFVYTLVQDVEESYERIKEIAATGAQPFAQPYRDFNGGEPTREQKRLARWCNHKATFKTVDFKDYKK